MADRQRPDASRGGLFKTGLNVDGGATLIAALVAGIAFFVLEIAAGYTLGFRPPFAPADAFLINVAGGASVRDFGFDFGPLLMAALFHVFLAIIFGFILTFIVYRWTADVGAAVGALYGIILLLIFSYTFGSMDELISLRGVMMFVGYVGYGVATAALYKHFEGR